MDGSRHTPHADTPGGHAHRLRRRRIWAHIRQGDSYGIVLLLILLTIVMGAGTYAPWLRGVQLLVSAFTLLAALRTSLVSARVMRWTALVVGLVVVAALLSMWSGSDEWSRANAGLVGALLAVVAPVAIVRRLVRHLEITLETVLGAVCVYLLIGLTFSYLYSGMDAIDGPFFEQVANATPNDFAFFSYVTITTVGYGNLVPAGSLGRMMAVLEALIGQIYLVTVVALLVGNLGRRRAEPAEGASPTPAEPAPDDAGASA